MRPRLADWWPAAAGLLLVLASIVIAIAFLLVAANRDLSDLETTLLQILTLGIGLAGSFVLGRQSARSAARELLKPHARSAFRRVLSLYRGMSNIGQAVESARADHGDSAALAKLEGLVAAHLFTADDALEDWRDIVPEDVAEVESRLRMTEKSGDSNE